MHRLARLVVPALIALAVAQPSHALPTTVQVARSGKLYVFGCFSAPSTRQHSCLEAHKVGVGVHVYLATARSLKLGLPSDITREEAVVDGKLARLQPGIRSGFELDVTLPKAGRLHLIGTDDGEILVNAFTVVPLSREPFIAWTVVADDQRDAYASIARANISGTLRGVAVVGDDVAYQSGLGIAATMIWVV